MAVVAASRSHAVKKEHSGLHRALPLEERWPSRFQALCLRHLKEIPDAARGTRYGFVEAESNAGTDRTGSSDHARSSGSIGTVTKQHCQEPAGHHITEQTGDHTLANRGLKIAADFQKSYPERRTGANNQAASPAGCAESEAVLKRSWQAMQWSAHGIARKRLLEMGSPQFMQTP